MQNNLKLRLQKNTVLSDIHHILLDPSLNETSKLQSICESLARALSLNLVWGGLLKQNNRLKIFGASGHEKLAIHGLNLDFSNEELTPISQCLSQMDPVFVSEGLQGVDPQAFSHLPDELLNLPVTLYPLSISQQCIGILAIESPDDREKSPERELMTMISQQTGFALGSLQAFLFNNLPQQNQKLAVDVFDYAQEGMLVTDSDGNIVSSNPSLSKITGYSQDELLGQPLQILQSDSHEDEFFQSLWNALTTDHSWQGEIRLQHKNGEASSQWLSFSAITDEFNHIQNYVGVFVDMSRQKEAEQQFLYQAYHDRLTGLANRELFMDRLNIALLHAKRNLQEIAVLFLNLDHFKQITDSVGQTGGDSAIKHAASTIQSCLRENDTLARLNGDEFAIILQDFSFQKDIRVVADRILAALDKSFEISGKTFNLSASIGISLFPEDSDNPQTLLKYADAAMYRAKQNGRKQLHFYQTDKEDYSIEHIEMERMLRNALKNGEFKLHYQPQFDLNNNQLIGIEALLRWEHPEKGLLTPEQFIPIAEASGLIMPIGDWVLNEVCIQASAWQKAGLKPLRISVNLSSRQFSFAGLSNKIDALLKQYGLDPTVLELEFTENTAMQHVETSLKTINLLKEAGIGMSIDDFGTGYSSMNTLKQLQVDRLKIDRSFIADITRSQNNAAIVAGIISMAKCLGLKVIAEGVESDDQLNFLRTNGCHEAQGYLLGRPQPADQFAQAWYHADNMTTSQLVS